MDKSFFSIYKTFFKIGTLLLGGGYVILPLLTSEIAQKKNWLTSDELCEYYAISTSLPGVIAINTAIFTGRKLGGFMGEIAAITGIVTPPFLAIILLASILQDIIHFRLVNYILWGVGIGIITLLFLAVKEMWGKCIIDKYTTFIYILALSLSIFTKISPALIIITTVIFAIIFQFTKNKKEGKNV